MTEEGALSQALVVSGRVKFCGKLKPSVLFVLENAKIVKMSKTITLFTPMQKTLSMTISAKIGILSENTVVKIRKRGNKNPSEIFCFEAK